jgi:hypothetical protein
MILSSFHLFYLSFHLPVAVRNGFRSLEVRIVVHSFISRFASFALPRKLVDKTVDRDCPMLHSCPSSPPLHGQIPQHPGHLGCESAPNTRPQVDEEKINRVSVLAYQSLLLLMIVYDNTIRCCGGAGTHDSPDWIISR